VLGAGLAFPNKFVRLLRLAGANRKAMTDDAALLRRYLDGSEEAFAELVRCHIGAVYGTALRVVAGDAHLANDVTQKVFTGLARKASSLADRTVLVGWLYLSTQYEAAKAVRSEQRWRNREQKAQVMNEILGQGAPEPDWTALRPVLDQAMRDLKEGDRDALLLRFFQSRTLAEVGEGLGLSENAARMRVDRALDKLHSVLVRRGIKSTATALGAALAGQLTTAAPATLAASVTSVALAGAASGAGATIFFMGLTKIQIGIAATLVVVGGSTLWSEHQTGVALRAENTALVAQVVEISHLKAESRHLDTNGQKAEALRREASAFASLREEEAQLKGAIEREEAARKAKAAADAQQRSKPVMQGPDAGPEPVNRVQPKYPDEMKVLGIPGEVLVELVVIGDGSVKDVKASKATNEAFAAAAIAAVEKWKFKPGQKGGRAVNTRIAVPIVFALDQKGVADWF
jgi:RNA polymerase sigma factor (sigma-70 family)